MHGQSTAQVIYSILVLGRIIAPSVVVNTSQLVQQDHLFFFCHSLMRMMRRMRSRIDKDLSQIQVGLLSVVTLNTYSQIRRCTTLILKAVQGRTPPDSSPSSSSV
jgi:hypothetical protein